jgi:hypothetical protein
VIYAPDDKLMDAIDAQIQTSAATQFFNSGGKTKSEGGEMLLIRKFRLLAVPDKWGT